MPLTKGYIQVYTGNGKGKTTAALGQVLRALGHNLTATVIQFMKGNIEYGELAMSKRLAPQFTLHQMGRDTFVNKKNPDPKDIEMAVEALALATKCVDEQSCDILVLDEINVALDFKLIPLSKVLELLGRKPDRMEILLTGRYAPQAILDRADLVTEMTEVKHYYAKGVQARLGIER
ncbi:MAG: cob(I)yrinic acid a,c-diamide adenosyltransferase [Pseudomonadota bacterium]